MRRFWFCSIQWAEKIFKKDCLRWKRLRISAWKELLWKWNHKISNRMLNFSNAVVEERLPFRPLPHRECIKCLAEGRLCFNYFHMHKEIWNRTKENCRKKRFYAGGSFLYCKKKWFCIKRTCENENVCYKPSEGATVTVGGLLPQEMGWAYGNDGALCITHISDRLYLQ